MKIDPVGVGVGRTGLAVQGLVQGVKADLLDIGTATEDLLTLIGYLEAGGKGINGLSSTCRGWRLMLGKMLEDVRKEADDVEKTLLGSARPKMYEQTNEALAAEVATLRLKADKLI